ncbi:MAG: hypothetical protein ACD_62C00338G0001 [uncultured bacterium]|nr:MAG: hypothetical protein ACD_62C00338G0001 [uncultured bacterium]
MSHIQKMPHLMCDCETQVLFGKNNFITVFCGVILHAFAVDHHLPIVESIIIESRNRGKTQYRTGTASTK